MGMPVPALLSAPRPLAICARPLLPFRRRHVSAEYTSADVLVLNFVCTRATNVNASGILNCAVVRPDDLCPYFHVVTRQDYLPGHTVVRTNAGRPVAWVEWVPTAHGGGAYVELQCDSVNEKYLHGLQVQRQKQRVSAWLGVSCDASYRIMFAHGQTYVWVPRAHSICLYHWDPTQTLSGDTDADADAHVPQLLARITKDDSNSAQDAIVALQISRPAIDAGLLEMCVVCVVLFQSGCKID
ncbi:hypothetical protein B0H11DRAFT_2109244 [Mycena galericulata]|nr:hypothetical protein B0H11DRAFT_2109244 [Mycena galericulata]